jgi:hypothetical protein
LREVFSKGTKLMQKDSTYGNLKPPQTNDKQLTNSATSAAMTKLRGKPGEAQGQRKANAVQLRGKPGEALQMREMNAMASLTSTQAKTIVNLA